jgi:uncharacterized membrane protein YgcG
MVLFDLKIQIIIWRLDCISRKDTSNCDEFGCVLMFSFKSVNLLSTVNLLAPTTSAAPVGREIRWAVRARRLDERDWAKLGGSTRRSGGGGGGSGGGGQGSRPR